MILSAQGASRDVWMFETEEGVTRVPVSGSVTSNSGEVVRDAAINGVGIAVKSLWDIGDELRDGRLVTVLDQHALTPVDIFAVYHNRRFVTPKVKAWVMFFNDKFGPAPYWA